jgi:hypothetical protein
MYLNFIDFGPKRPCNLIKTVPQVPREFSMKIPLLMYASCIFFHWKALSPRLLWKFSQSKFLEIGKSAV